MKKFFAIVLVIDIIITACVLIPVALLTKSWIWTIIAFCGLVLLKAFSLGGIVAKIFK